MNILMNLFFEVFDSAILYQISFYILWISLGPKYDGSGSPHQARKNICLLQLLNPCVTSSGQRYQFPQNRKNPLMSIKNDPIRLRDEILVIKFVLFVFVYCLLNICPLDSVKWNNFHTAFVKV